MPKLTLTFDPVTYNQLGSSSIHGECACEVWKWSDKNCSLYRVHKVLHTECQSWPWPLTPLPKINRVPPLIIHNLHAKFESYWAGSKIEKVPRGIRGEKSSKDMASSRNLVSTIGALASPKMGTEPGVKKGKRSLLACHTRCKCSMETTHNRGRSSSVLRSWNWWKVWLVGKSLLVKDQNVI